MTQHPEHRRLIRLADAYNSKAERLGLTGRITPAELARKANQCFYCGIGLEIGQGTYDHVVPFDRGGDNTDDNIVRSCLTCNREKFNKTPDEFAAHKELIVSCKVCGKLYRPRWAEFVNGRARTCSLSCAAKLRWKK